MHARVDHRAVKLTIRIRIVRHPQASRKLPTFVNRLKYKPRISTVQK